MESFKTMHSGSYCSDLLLNEDLSDVRVIVENKMETSNFPAHSYILKRGSPVIAKMLASGFVEGQSQTIEFTDFKAIHVEMFLKFLYTDVLPEMYSGVCELVKIADKYLVSNLTERCIESLLNFVNRQNVYELCTLADRYSLEKLLDKCMFLIKRAGFKLLKCDDLKCLSKQVMEMIVCAHDLNVTKEIDVFWAIWRWGNWTLSYYQCTPSSNENVIALIADLLAHVRWNLIDEDEQKKIVSFGIVIADADQCPIRESSTMDMAWFLNQCDILQMVKYSPSCMLLKEHFNPSTDEVELMHAVSLSDLPFYVVGVLFAICVKENFGATLVCSCDDSSSVARKHVPIETSAMWITDKTIKYEGSKKTCEETTVAYGEIVYEFPKPVEVRKHQQLVIKIKDILYPFGGIRLKFERKVVGSHMGRNLFVDGEVVGIKKIFLL